MMKGIVILLTVLAVLGSAGAEQQRKSEVLGTAGGPDSAKTVDEIKRSVLFGKNWKIHNINGLRILVGMSELPTSGESYIDVHGYVYNRYFKEWRRFCLVKTRNIGWGEVRVDKKAGVVYLLAKANNELKGKRVFQFDIAVLSDDRAYVKDNISGDPIKVASATFKAKRTHGMRPHEAAILYPIIRTGMSRAQVKELLGAPDDKWSADNRWCYTVGYSQFFEIEFKGDTVLRKIGGESFMKEPR